MKYFMVFTLLLLLAIGCSNPVKQNNTNSYSRILDIDVPEEEIIFDESKGQQSTDRNFYFLFDGSGSMADICAGERKIDGAKKAISLFLDKVPEDANLGLLVFGIANDSGIKEVVPLGANNRELFEQAIQSVYPQKSTPLTAATNYGIDQLVTQYKKQLGYGEYRLIIVTDGIANSPEYFEQALIESQRYPFVAIYGIGLCMDGDHALKQVAYSYADASDYKELGKALEQTIAELPVFDPAEFVEE